MSSCAMSTMQIDHCRSSCVDTLAGAKARPLCLFRYKLKFAGRGIQVFVKAGVNRCFRHLVPKTALRLCSMGALGR
jgi:hypothetical protein